MKGLGFWIFLLGILFSMGQEQNILTAKEIEYEGHIDLKKISELLEKHTPLNTLDYTPWEAFPYKPKVQFRIAHSNNQIWLKYYVEEENILAKRTNIHGSVSRDSCVEFFFDPLGDGHYYNFEFNCIGTPHLSYGPDRYDREFVDTVKMKKQIHIKSSLGNIPFVEKGGGHQWEMVVVLPATLLTVHPGIGLKGLSSRANFYKCGDDTALKHYVTWNPVGTPRPDYHQPDFFGRLVFE